MAKNRALRRQARAIAAGGLPSAGSIKRQYHRQEGDVADFSSALVSLLKGQQGVAGQAYGSAIQQQQGIDDAARQQLGNLGEQYGAGSAVKVGATGDSAVSSLLGGQAAAQDYASRQPGIAASRGALGQTALENALSDALSQRRDQIHQGFLPAYLQLKQNAFSQKMALQQLGLSKQQLADSESAQAFSEQQQTATFQEQQREFRITEKDKRRASRAAGLSPSEFRQEAAIAQGIVGAPKAKTSKVAIYATRPDGSRYITGYKQVPIQGQDTRDIAQKGTPFRSALQQLLTAGVQQPVAEVLLAGLYSKYAHAPTDSPAFKAYLSYYHIQHPNRIGRAERRNTGLTGPH